MIKEANEQQEMIEVANEQQEQLVEAHEEEIEVPNCISVENTINSTFNQVRPPNECNLCRDDDEMSDLEAIEPMRL